VRFGNFRSLGIALLPGLAGGSVGRMMASVTGVHAQEYFSGVTNRITVVPKSWGAFKGGSEYGLAFEHEKGVVRFVQHPICGSVNSPEAKPAPSAEHRFAYGDPRSEHRA
jgi:hypothetical protein